MCSGLNLLKSCLSTFYAIIKISNMDCQKCLLYPFLSNVSRHLLCHAPGDQYCLCYQIWIAVYTLRALPLHWRHNGRDGVANHQRLDYSFSCLFRRRSKKTSKLRVTGLCVGGIHRWPVNSSHKGTVTRKMFPFGDAIVYTCNRLPFLIVANTAF